MTDDSPRDPPVKPRKSDMASAHMQTVYKEQLKKHAMFPMFSRYGRETKNYHNEFMKVHSEVRQSKLDESQRTQPKVNTNRTFSTAS